MKLPRLKSAVRNVPLSRVRQIDDTGIPFARSSTEHLRLRGRALQVRNERIAVRDMYTCQVCGRIVDRHEGQVDHRIPLAQGGTDGDGNLQWICTEPCHREKTERENARRLTDSDVSAGAPWKRSC